MKFLAVMLIACAAIQTTVVSCSDEPDVENYYTSTSHYASSFLQENEQYSLFVQILDRAKLLGYLGTYGEFTIFAPTNDAVNTYLASNGYASVADMSDETCKDVAYNHIIDGHAYYITDIKSGQTYENMLYHPLAVAIDSDSVSVPGEILLQVSVNRSSLMVQMDDSVENGVIHTMSSVISMDNDQLDAYIGRDPNVSLFYEALVLTGMDQPLKQNYIDNNYTIQSDSINWDNDRLVVETATEADNVAYPRERRFRYTVFCPTNEALSSKYGVTDIAGLQQLAYDKYHDAYPDDASVTDPKDRRNYLNRFVSYHMLNRLGRYFMLTCIDGIENQVAVRFNRDNWDIADWYETMMPYSIMKCSFPSGSRSGLYLNRRGIKNRPDKLGHFVRGALVTPPDQMKDMTNECANGIYHYIDDIITYDLETQNELFKGERLRIDCSTLSPDFMNQTGYGGSTARGHYTRNGIYGIHDATKDKTNKQLCLGFKAGFVENFDFKDENTHLHVRPRTLGFWSYQCDELCIVGNYNINVKLPPVPEGDYELRMMTCVEFPNRGIVQFYIDDVPQGIPFDMRPSGESTKIGWQRPTGDAEQDAAFDKQFHYRGWMRGPKAFSPGGDATTMRDISRTLRRVIGTFHSNGKEYHYLRMQQKMQGGGDKNTCDFDFIELCPSAIYNNPDVAEDVW